jgi:hypothetical protein
VEFSVTLKAKLEPLKNSNKTLEELLLTKFIKKIRRVSYKNKKIGVSGLQ